VSGSPDNRVGGGLAEAGRHLREARAKRGWTLPQVAERIHVAIRYLEAIENGDVSGVPAAVYMRGFVINYVRILGLEEEAILRLLDEDGVGIPGGIQPATTGSRAAAREKARVNLVPDWRRNLVLIASVVVIGVLLGLAIRGVTRMFSRSQGEGVPPSPFESGSTTQPARVAAAKPAESVPKSAVLRKFAVGVTALQECWMQSQVDDGKTTDIELKPGEARWFMGAERIRLFIGNGAGVLVTGPQGGIAMPEKAGKVVHLLVTRTGVEKLKMPLAPPPSSTLAR